MNDHPSAPRSPRSRTAAMAGLLGLLILSGFITLQYSRRCAHLERHGTRISRGTVDLGTPLIMVSDDSISAWGYVSFGEPFETVPEVFMGLAQVDSPTQAISRLQLKVLNVTQAGFEYEMSGWSQAGLNPGKLDPLPSAQAEWVAYDRRTPGNAFGLGDSISDEPQRLFHGDLIVEAYERGFLVRTFNGKTELFQLTQNSPGTPPYGALGDAYANLDSARQLGAPLEGERPILSDRYRVHVFLKGVLFWRAADGQIDHVLFRREFNPPD